MQNISRFSSLFLYYSFLITYCLWMLSSHYSMSIDFVSDMCFSPFDDGFLATGSFDGDVGAIFLQ